MRTAILVLFFTAAAGLSPAFAHDEHEAKIGPKGATIGREADDVGGTRQGGGGPPAADPIVFRHGYRLSIGPWSIRFSLPPGIDLLDLGDRVRALMGLMLIVGVGVYLSEDRAAISWRLVFWCLTIQWVLAVFLLRTAAGGWLLGEAGLVVDALVGGRRVGRNGPEAFLIGFVALPTVVVGSVVCAVLYHLGVMQRLVRSLAAVTSWVPGTSGAESLDVAATMLVGQTEAPLTIRPYLPRLTRSEMLTVMTAGMANVSGLAMGAYVAFGIDSRQILISVLLSAPGAVLISKLLIPETGTPETYGGRQPDLASLDAGLLAAAWRGTREGIRMAFFIAAALVVVFGLIALVDQILGLMGTSLEAFFGWALAPVAYMLGVAWDDCRPVGEVLGTRTALNEWFAIQDLSHLRGAILDRSFMIAGFALCGFANLGSLAIQLCGLGALAPGRRADLARLGVRALLAATLASFLSACIAGILL